MKNYFSKCASLDEAKILYKSLAFKLHPDVSGYDSTAEFQAMQNEFAKFKPSKEKYKDEFENFHHEAFMQMIADLMKIKGIEFEVCGSFIWLSGDTKPVKDQIKEIKNEAFKPACWHREKCRWFFSPSDYKRRGGKKFSMDEIRNKYGSEMFANRQDFGAVAFA